MEATGVKARKSFRAMVKKIGRGIVIFVLFAVTAGQMVIWVDKLFNTFGGLFAPAFDNIGPLYGIITLGFSVTLSATLCIHFFNWIKDVAKDKLLWWMVFAFTSSQVITFLTYLFKVIIL